VAVPVEEDVVDADAPEDQPHRQDVLGVVGLERMPVDHVGPAPGEAEDDPLDVGRAEARVGGDAEKGVEPGVGEGAGGVALVRELAEVGALAPRGQQRLPSRAPRECGEGVVPAVERRRRPAEPEARERGRRHPVARGEPGVERPRVLGRVVGPGEEPARLLQGEPERDRLAARVESEQVAGGRGRAEGPAYRRRVEPAGVQRDRVERVRHPAGDLDAHDHRGQEPAPVGALGLRHRQARRHQDRRRVQDRPIVVGLDVAVVGERSVGEGGVHPRGAPPLADQARLRRAAEAADQLHHETAGRVLGDRGGQHGAHRVEEAEPALGHDLGRDVAQAEGGDPGRQLGGDGGDHTEQSGRDAGAASSRCKMTRGTTR
jgi:hypothetical protein